MLFFYKFVIYCRVGFDRIRNDEKSQYSGSLLPVPVVVHWFRRGNCAASRSVVISLRIENEMHS